MLRNTLLIYYNKIYLKLLNLNSLSMKVFCGTHSHDFASKVAYHLNTPLGKKEDILALKN